MIKEPLGRGGECYLKSMVRKDFLNKLTLETGNEKETHMGL